MVCRGDTTGILPDKAFAVCAVPFDGGTGAVVTRSSFRTSEPPILDIRNYVVWDYRRVHLVDPLLQCLRLRAMQVYGTARDKAGRSYVVFKSPGNHSVIRVEFEDGSMLRETVELAVASDVVTLLGPSSGTDVPLGCSWGYVESCAVYHYPTVYVGLELFTHRSPYDVVSTSEVLDLFGAGTLDSLVRDFSAAPPYYARRDVDGAIRPCLDGPIFGCPTARRVPTEAPAPVYLREWTSKTLRALQDAAEREGDRVFLFVAPPNIYAEVDSELYEYVRLEWEGGGINYSGGMYWRYMEHRKPKRARRSRRTTPTSDQTGPASASAGSQIDVSAAMDILDALAADDGWPHDDDDSDNEFLVRRARQS